MLFRSDRPLVPPLERRGIPARVLGSHAVAESHGYIVRSLGFAIAEPEASEVAAKDRDPEAWKQVWQERAIAAVGSAARLAFVHVLRVDSWGHHKGRGSSEYATAAVEADRIVAQPVATAPMAAPCGPQAESTSRSSRRAARAERLRLARYERRLD